LKEFIIPVPNTAHKLDLVEMKKYLQELEPWETEIFIDIRWNKLSTKIKIKNYNEIKDWAEKKWSIIIN
jgi:hypothetical protein